MMIPAFRKYLCWASLLILWNINGNARQHPDGEQIYFFKQGDSLSLTLPDSICLVRPIYENKDQLKRIYPVCYTTSQGFSSIRLADSLQLGCYFISTRLFAADSVFYSYNILQDYPEIRQIIITRSDGYLGFLEELLNVPFVLPPRSLADYRHQTDLRLAVDCAELAIYGRRRQGYPIPYCGPKRIANYMKRTDRLKPGTIIHFKHQVSVLYEDKGIPGVLDPEDLLIHAYKDKAEIIPLKNTDLVGQKYILLEWE